MSTKTYKSIGFLALSSLFYVLTVFTPSMAKASEDMPIIPVADKLKSLPAGFYQFNNLEIFKSPAVDEPPITIDVIQKNDKSCSIYENGKTDKQLSCVFNGNQDNTYTIQIDERSTLLGVNQEPALLTDFQAGDKINVLGWLAADSKTIRAAMVRNLESKATHQALSGTVKEIRDNGFVITVDDNDIFVETPIQVGAQITIKGVFDKAKNTITNVLSLFVKPNIVLKETSTKESAPASTPSPKPSTLFKNFLKVFGL